MNPRAATRSRLSVLPVFIALLFNVAMVAPIGAGVDAARASHVAPQPKDDNPTCGSFGDYDHEFRINAPGNGTYSDADSDFDVTLTFHNTAAGQTVDFSANLPVDAVFIKGGPNGNLYVYDPPGPAVTADTGLHSQVNPKNGTYYGISHISFCFDDVPLLPRLTIEKTPDGATVNAGSPISFTISVTNSAQATAPALNVDIDDDLPAGFSWAESPNTAECSITGAAGDQSLHCDIASLAIGASFSVTVSAPTDGSICGEIANVAFADADGLDQISDDGSVTITCADIRVEKTPDQGSITAGDAATFTMTVSNDGNGAATGVTLFDDLPGSGWSIVAAQTTLTRCVVNNPGGDETLTCGPDTIQPGEANAKKVTVTRTATAADCPTITNEASVTAGNDGEDTDGGMIGVLCGKIEVDKTPDDGQVNAPGTATFSIVTTNSGNGEARDAELFDDLPELSGSWTIDAKDWLSCLVSDDDHPTLGDIGSWLSCGPEDIAAGDDRTVTISASVTTDDCGPVANEADVLTSNDGADEDGALITVLCPDLDIDKTTTTPEVNAGDDVNYTVTVNNTGDGPANGVTITDELPAGITWSETSDDCEILLGTLTCGPLTINAKSSFSVTVTGTTDAGECPSIENSASFTSTNAGSGSTSEAPTEIMVNCPDLEVLKSGSGVVVAGNEVDFTITVTNNGEGDATGVVLTDSLPVLGSGTWTITDLVGIGAEDCAIADDILSCTLDELASGASFSVTVSATSDPDDCPSLTNDASVSASNEPSDGQTQADNEDDHTITVNCPDISVAKEATTPVVNAGDLATFTITVTAGGSGSNEDVTLTDNLIGDAADWAFEVSDDGSNDDCSISVSAVLLCEFGNLAPDDSVTVVLTYQTDPGDCPSVANTASVSAAADIDQSNNQSDEVVISVNCPDITVDKEAVASPISAGEQGQFTIEVTNNGPGTARDVVMADTAPEGTVWTVLDDGGASCTSDLDGDQQTITCEIGDLADDASVAVLIGYTTSQADCGTLDNSVAVQASNEPLANTDDNTDEASIIVECPGLNLVKTADADPIDAGDEASFTITLWNIGPGDAFDVTLHEDLPAGLPWDFDIVSGDATDEDCSPSSSMVPGGEQQVSIDCEFGTVGVTSMEGGIVIRVFATTDRTDCGLLENSASADGSNLDEPLTAGASILVRCPTITLEKANDAAGSVLPGTEVTYTLTLTVDDGPADDVMVVDVMPAGLEHPSDISDGGTFDEATNTITWDLGDLATGEYTLTYQAVVADDVEHGEELVNAAAATSTNSQCPDLETLGPECEDGSTVIVRVPTLVIDKVADTEVITITGPNDDLVATPSVVTWTLTYTLTNGPVTNAVITDEIPVGFEFLDASDGGTLIDNVVTWAFPTLSESGSVTFRTTVDPETISRVAPTVNVAVIASDETPEEEGEDGVTVIVEPPVAGGNPTPKPSLPDTAAGTGLNGEPVTVPVELLVAFFLGSLGALALVNVRARSRRR